MLLALAIFVATIALVIWQPKGLGIGWSAMGGAAIALLVGVVSLSDVPVVWGIVWNATATFVAIIIVSLLLDEAGFFEWAALHVARWGRGHGRRLFVLIVLLGAAVSALFANDGAALILTPIVIAMLRALGYKDKATLAFVMAAGFIADTASLPLIVSNLVNIVSADFFRIGFAEYASVMVPVDLASIASTLVALLLFFRREIPTSYDVTQLRTPADAIRDPATFKAGGVVLALLLAGFFLLAPIGVPVSAVAAAGAVLLSHRRARPCHPDPQSAGRCAVASRDLLARHVPGRLWTAECWPDQPPCQLARSHRARRRVGRGVRDRNHRGTAVVGDEQHADCAGGRAIDRRDARHRRDQGGDDLRQRDRVRPWPEDHADRLARDAALAACPRAKGHPDRLGLLLQGWRNANDSGAVDDTRRAGNQDQHGMTALVYLAAALAEIAGCFAFWAWLRLGKSPLWLAPGVVSLMLFAWLLTRVDSDAAGRAYAAYGGVYICASLIWLWAVEGVRPDRWDAGGAALCLIGTCIILLGPRTA